MGTVAKSTGHQHHLLSMTASIRILTTSSLDSSPSLLLVSPNGSKTLINCGEGCQRSFLESSSTNASGVGTLRVSSVNRICLTHIGHDALGGLPGMILTTADVAEAAAIEFQQQSNVDKGGEPIKRKASSMLSNDGIPDIEIVGPTGTKTFLHSLRHFMRRDRFNVHTYEGQFDSSKLNNTSSQRQHVGIANKRAKKKIQKDNEETSFTVESIPVSYTVASNPIEPTQSQQITQYVISYVFTTPPIHGKFLIEKARELNVPMGPLCGQLKAGKSVTFIDPKTNEEKTVDSTEVVAKESPGVGVAVVYCPTIQVFGELKMSSTLRAFEKNRIDDDASTAAQLDAIVHLTPRTIFESGAYQSWCAEFGSGVDHIILHVAESVEERAANNNASPFVSAMRGGIRRSFLHDGLFPRPEIPIPKSDDNKRTTASLFIEGCPMMEYLLMPRSKRGLNACTMKSVYSATEIDDLRGEVHAAGAFQLAQTIATDQAASIPAVEQIGKGRSLGELIFTGTGSAVPCKHRNVTGMYLRMNNGNSMLLDVGEGTVGQLLQLWKSTLPKSASAVDEYHSRLRGIKAVWISHPHADHHLGLLRLLSERSAIVGSSDPLVLIAPPNMFAFLSEYQLAVPEIKGSYVELDCRDLFPGQSSPLCRKLREELGISCTSVQVTHCPYSYAVVVDGTAFGRLAYSGDCRPSSRFAVAGNGADVLIHEATFEDGMKEEAVLKKHSTVGEAIEIACKMDAKTLILTHFSQRYPKIPPVNRNESDTKAMAVPIAFAFDFMRVTPSSLPLATKLTPALRLLYPGQEGDTTEANNDLIVDSKELMAVPGMFSAQGIL